MRPKRVKRSQTYTSFDNPLSSSCFTRPDPEAGGLSLTSHSPSIYSLTHPTNIGQHHVSPAQIWRLGSSTSHHSFRTLNLFTHLPSTLSTHLFTQPPGNAGQHHVSPTQVRRLEALGLDITLSNNPPTPAEAEQ